VDEDCGSHGGACACGDMSPYYGYFYPYVNTCVFSECRSNADCESGLCFAALQADCGGASLLNGFACATKMDECRSDEFCEQQGKMTGCSYDFQRMYFSCDVEEAEVYCD
jgi:hypothetical protein